MATDTKIKIAPANAEAMPEPPPEWLIKLAKQTCERVDQAHRRVVELDRKYGR